MREIRTFEFLQDTVAEELMGESNIDGVKRVISEIKLHDNLQWLQFYFGKPFMELVMVQVAYSISQQINVRAILDKKHKNKAELLGYLIPCLETTLNEEHTPHRAKLMHLWDSYKEELTKDFQNKTGAKFE